MMIAIIILGLGMLMAAVMFPTGWIRARQLSEFTSESAAANTAATTVQLLCKVASDGRKTSFLGDLDSLHTESGADLIDNRFIYPLHIENVLFEDRNSTPWPEFLYSDADPGDVMALSRTDFISIVGSESEFNNWTSTPSIPPMPQVALHERLYPPLDAPPITGDPDYAQKKKIWNELVSSRRFAWAVLHRIEAAAGPDDDRVISMYLITLKRTKSSHRYARQDPGEPTDTPKALDATEDMLLPVPWVINLTVHGSWDPSNGSPLDPRGIPSEMDANSTGAEDGKLVAQMLAPGSVLIDRIVGNIYTVKQHRFTGTGANYDWQATVTVDREITELDLGLPDNGFVRIDTIDDGTAPTLGGNLRDFWVFPPPVLADRPNRFVVYDGQQPVVGVETRRMVFSPAS